MAPTVTPIGPALDLGEGPYWDEENQTLFYVDIFKHSIHSYRPQTDEHHVVEVDSEGQPVSLIVKVKGEQTKFVISVKNSLATVHWDGLSTKSLKPEVIVNLEGSDNPTRINDGKCDPSNRLWAGTMSSKKEDHTKEVGSFYLLQHDKKVVKHLSNVSISNGLAWSLDKKKMYYIDSLKYGIDSYDYDETSGTISNGKQVFCFKKNNIDGFPDGMTIDSEGMLWVACFMGARVLRIDPTTGELKFTLQIPSYQVTSVCFGGPNLEDLYVTSAKQGFTEELEEKYPLAGYSFKVTGLGVKGTPSVPIKL
ncbi:regucalcin-like [Macrosteles quadrilineatus]|uniref:regucalcin-like n=1 Tax=Macrosteles quadrilineatus TaxID=74068 RepID=UPI0023E22E27|nr:regucalcin-like [Macrosteles quadrilineatus]XP_054272317.1 regucalcin-like [Macrosteles quadrilineatus]